MNELKYEEYYGENNQMENRRINWSRLHCVIPLPHQTDDRSICLFGNMHCGISTFVQIKAPLYFVQYTIFK